MYVELEATPWIWRISQDANHGQNPDSTQRFSVTSHDGRTAQVQRCVLDEHGRVYLQADIGFGLVHTQDVALAADAVEAGVWVPQAMMASELPQRFGYVSSPQSTPLNAT